MLLSGQRTIRDVVLFPQMRQVKIRGCFALRPTAFIVQATSQ